MTADALRRTVLALAVASMALAAVTVTNSVAWIDRVFPGFLVLENRVVPSIALPSWSPGQPERFFQHEIAAVDGVPVASARAVYDAVARRPVGDPVRYTMRAPDGHVFEVVVPARRFALTDYTLLLGAFLLVSLAFVGTGCWVAFVKPASAAARGLLAMGLCAGVWGITALDLYGPYWFVRLHVVGETMIGAAAIHLALVFPVERLPRTRRHVLVALYGVFGVLALVYQWALPRPVPYTMIHLVVTALQGVGSFALVAASVAGYFADASPLVRRRVGVVAAATVSGFMAPAIVFSISGVIGGKLPVNLGIAPAVVFPLGIGYAIVQRDLFEIDVFIRRASTYALVVVTVATIYLAILLAATTMLPGVSMSSPLALALPNLLLLFLLAPIQRRVQAGVDAVFFRTTYDATVVQANLSHALAVVHNLTGVVEVVHQVIDRALSPSTWALFLIDDGARLERAGGDGPALARLPDDLWERCLHGRVVSRYEEAVPGGDFWEASGAELLIPIRGSGRPIAVLLLGATGSGRPYTMHDGSFLRAVASQVALALTSAKAFAQLEELNAGLEQQVHQRTAELERANSELERSVDQVRGAYQQLERSQVSLVRADRLATLGRLAAGIAHEMNTPLAAVQNSLKILRDLGDEYAASIDDEAVTTADHREIAHEIAGTAVAAAGWARKAAAFLAKVKLHARESNASGARVTRIAEVIAETQALLAHRLRASDCALTVDAEPDLCATGDPGRLGQVLVNLVGNALDAYEDRALRDWRIAIAARRIEQGIVLTVRDWAGGIPTDVLPRIFDELYTTKEPGRGTGLGLWIARTLIEEQFGGTLTVSSALGDGSTFTLWLPSADAADVEAA